MDYRFKALQNVLRSDDSTLNLKEGGGMLAGFFDESAAENQREYLQLLELTFEHMKAGDLAEEEVKATLQALSKVFSEESDELETLCDHVEGLEDVMDAWHGQTDEICDALLSSIGFYESGDPQVLDDALAVVKQALEERLPLYGQISVADAKAGE